MLLTLLLLIPLLGLGKYIVDKTALTGVISKLTGVISKLGSIQRTKITKAITISNKTVEKDISWSKRIRLALVLVEADGLLLEVPEELPP